jgi:cobalt-zinc-cadmium resistance protein CzcA
MIDRIIQTAIQRRYTVLALAALLIVIGAWNYQRLPIDAVPDITNVQVQINTEAPGYSPLETEQRITFPVETALYGLPQLEYTRSLSRYGLSQVTVVFKESTDIYHARNLIDERLSTIKAELPQGLEPKIGPIATGLGEIFLYTVEADPDARQPNGEPYDAMALRELQDWVIRPQLAQVLGVVEVNTIGGFDKQFHVLPDPRKMLQHGVGLEQIAEALESNNRNQGAGYIERNGQQLLVRSPGQFADLDAIREAPVGRHGATPITVADVAQVAIGRELRTGAATRDGRETVLGNAMMLIGENARVVSLALEERLKSIQPSLPPGITAEAVYNRTTLVDKTIATVRTNLLEGALLVIVVLFLLLGNLRAALITAAVIPLSMLATVTGMVQTGVSANLMSLGALDFGLIVDGAVIVVENCVRRLGMAQQQGKGALALRERLDVVYRATSEVIRPALFGVGIITLVYLPIFSLTGVEGKMFHPMAATVMMALLAAMVLCVTVVPAAVAILMRGRVRDRQSVVFRGASALYTPLLGWAMRLRWLVVTFAAILVAASLWLAQGMGREFIPQLDEGDIAMHAMRVTGTGLEQSIAMQMQLEAHLQQVPEIDKVFGRIGTAEVANDPMPPNVADTFIMLKPREQWPKPDKPKAVLIEELEALANEVPGNNYEFTQPIEMRFNALISGVRSDLGIKIYGDDLDQLLASAERIAAVVMEVPGAAGVRVEQVDDLPMLSVEPRRSALARYGLTLADMQDVVATAVAGRQIGVMYQGDRRFKLMLRMPDAVREDANRLAMLPVMLPGGDYVPLGEVATIREETNPAQIQRENGKRRVTVTANVRERDLGSFVGEVQQRIEADIRLPTGYWLDYGGSFEQLASASQRFTWVLPITLLMIFGLLTMALQSFRDAAIVFTGVPLALTGGILALWLRGIPLSISAGVGFIALSGIAVLNGLVMLSQMNQLRKEGSELVSAVIDGARVRLRPVLMTALVASLGFVPMALNVGVGAEVQRPLATVVIGGVISSTLLTLLVLPALYRIVHGAEQYR